MPPRRSLNATVGVLIVGLVVLASVASFVTDGGMEYYARSPLKIVMVLAASGLLGIPVWIGARLL